VKIAEDKNREQPPAQKKPRQQGGAAQHAREIEKKKREGRKSEGWDAYSLIRVSKGRKMVKRVIAGTSKRRGNRNGLAGDRRIHQENFTSLRGRTADWALNLEAPTRLGSDQHLLPAEAPSPKRQNVPDRRGRRAELAKHVKGMPDLKAGSVQPSVRNDPIEDMP